MRHGVGTRKLGRTTKHRLAMFNNMLAGFFKAERIITTVEKAKEIKPFAERIVTWGKKDSLHARRMVYRYIPDHTLVKRIFEDVAPRFIDRSGGYTRILKIGARRGDNAEAAILEFVDFKFKPKAKKGKGKDKAVEPKADKKAASKPEKKAPAKPKAEKNTTAKPKAEKKVTKPIQKAVKEK